VLCIISLAVGRFALLVHHFLRGLVVDSILFGFF